MRLRPGAELVEMKIEPYSVPRQSEATTSEQKHRQQLQITCKVNEEIINNLTGSSIDSLEMADQMLSTGGITQRNNSFISLKQGSAHARDR